MIRKILATSLLSIATVLIAYSQSGALRGKITDKKTKEPLPFVNVVLEQNGNIITGGASDFNGDYMIKPIPPGKYNLKATNMGYQPIQISGIVIMVEITSTSDIAMSKSSIDLEVVEIIEYTIPIFEKGQTTSGTTVTKEDIGKMAVRGATDVAKTVGGVFSKDDGSGDLNFRGGRSDANFIIVDGVKRRASSAVNKNAIEQVSVITGGLPAQYGDVTGGIISITTRGASRTYTGSVDYLTSGFKIGDKMYGLDAYGYNLLEGSISGPLFFKRDSTFKTDSTGKKTGDPLFGFFLSGNVTSIIDDAPSALGWFRVKEDVRNELINNPLRQSPGAQGAILNHEFLRLSDLEKVKTRQNAAQNGINLSGKIDAYAAKNTSLTFGGSLDMRKEREFRYTNSLMNWQNNPQLNFTSWNVYSRFTQRFGAEDTVSKIRNVYYSIQLDYNRDKYLYQDDTHKDNLFNYGYVGKFVTYKAPYYQIPGQNNPKPYFVMQTFRDTLISFQPGTQNPEIAQFTQSYYNLFGWEGFDSSGNPIYDYTLANPNAGTGTGGFSFYDPSSGTIQPVFSGDLDGYFDELATMQSYGALFNGDVPFNVYDIWRTPAFQYDNYQINNNSQFRINANGSADVMKHALTLGFEFEQRIDRAYAVSPVALWNLGRQLANSHIRDLDFSDSTESQTGTSWPVVSYGRLNASPGAYDAFDGIEPQYFFDYNLRNKLGLDPDGTDWIDFDSYDPSTFSIDMFSADELNNKFKNGGVSGITYYGYDHKGKLSSSNPTFDDFFTAKDEFGNYTRPVGAFRPVYVAGYVQDKFFYNDLSFTIGLRADRFDANQYVLKDPYSLFPTVKAGEDLKPYGIKDYVIPSNIGENFVVYSDDISNPTTIIGFRNGDKWYNAQGAEIADASTLRIGGQVHPLLVDKNKRASKDITSVSFEDYKPKTNFLPRIAFSFSISDVAQFFAHYDVLTKRPGTGNRLDPTDYYFLQQVSYVLNNPNLQPEKTIDYEVGFKQALPNNKSSLTLSSFYRELRNMVQIINVVDAYPRKYTTYGNIDFGTVKGFTVVYDLRRVGNVKMNASYTLQFAEGTGSDAQSGFNLARADKQNLRTNSPLNYDQRHAVVLTFDYRFPMGKEFSEPLIFGKPILAGTGLNLVFNAGSGTPYNRQSGITGQGFIVPTGSASMKGMINGSRLPWQFKADARLDRDFEVVWKTKKDGEAVVKKKSTLMNVYFQVLNVFNAKNVIGVYRATGNPDDDGYLNAAVSQPSIEQQYDEQSFRELYSAKVNSPFNYSLPRRVRLGLLINFE